MSGAHVKVSIDMTSWSADLKRAMNSAESPEPFLKSIGEEFLNIVEDRFKTETGPDGEKWQALSPLTIKRREKKFPGAPITILRMRGQLAGSIAKQVTGPVLRIGTSGEVDAYALIHQEGGMAGRGRKVTIPQRAYLGWSEDDQLVIEEEATQFFFGSLL